MIDPQLIEENFKQLSEENKPWTFWYWINDNVSKEGIPKIWNLWQRSELV